MNGAFMALASTRLLPPAGVLRCSFSVFLFRPDLGALDRKDPRAAQAKLESSYTLFRQRQEGCWAKRID